MKRTSEGILYPEDGDYTNWAGQLMSTAWSIDTALEERAAAITDGLTPCGWLGTLTLSNVPASTETFVNIQTENYNSSVQTFTLAAQSWRPEFDGWYEVNFTTTFMPIGTITANSMLIANLIVNDATYAPTSVNHSRVPIQQTYYPMMDRYPGTSSPPSMSVNGGLVVEMNGSSYFTLSISHGNTGSNMNIAGFLGFHRICPSVV